MGTTAGKRVQGADVLTVRYQRGMGWPVTACTGDTKATFTVKPYAGDASITPKAPADPDLSFSKNDIALITDCNTSEIYQVGNAVSSGAANSYPSVNLTPLESGPPNTATCFGNYSGQDVRAFNFSTDFVTVTYFLQLKANPSADAPAGSLIPVLVRRTAAGKSSGTAGSTGVPVDTELVEGVERLDFLYGVEDDSGSVSYLTAKDVDAITVCPSKATSEAKCGWRSVKSIEVHLLVDTVDSTFGLTSADTAYRYGGNSVTSATMNDGPAPSSTMPVTGLKAGSMMRREFVSLISLRNNSP
jgi:type IV pilus assembly protein PilW